MKIIFCLFMTLYSIIAFTQPDRQIVWYSSEYPVSKPTWVYSVVYYDSDSGYMLAPEAKYMAFVDTSYAYFYSDTFDLTNVSKIYLPGTSSQYLRGDGSFVSFPSIPTNTNQLTNGAGFLITSDIAGKLNISDTSFMLTPYLKSSVASGTYLTSLAAASTYATIAQMNAKQGQLSGTGFVKISGTTISYDNSTYLSSESDPVFAAHASNGITSTLIGNWNTAFSWGNHFGLYAASSHTHTFASLTSKPTTLSGYGITDAYPLSGNPSGFLTSFTEVDGSTSNEIELPSQTGQAGKVLQTNGTSVSWITPASAPGTSYYTSYSLGTGYNITTTSAKIDFTGGGSVDPSITITTPGTYLITSNVRIDYNGLTNVAANTVSVKLRRTNNTAADITSATGDFTVPPVTLLTSTGGDCDVNTIIYTTANSNDVIELWASRSASISVGNIVAGNAWIVAHRIY